MEIILALVVFALVIVGMSVGVIFKNKPITGSCGGLNALTDEGKCSICGVEAREQCAKKAAKAQEAKRS